MTRKLFRTVLIVLLAATTAASVADTAAAQPAAPPGASTLSGPLEPVPVDLSRYLGTWNQVASIPAWFDLFCLRDTQARYTLNPDQTVRVFNTCSGPFGITIPIEGRARVADPVTNGALQVSFLSLFGFQLYFGGTNYVIAAHDPDYTWALVGSPHRSTGFLLTRSPALTPQQWQTARDAVTAARFDACRFNTTVTTGGLSTRQPLCTLE